MNQIQFGQDGLPSGSPQFMRQNGYINFGSSRFSIISNLTRFEKIEMVMLLFHVDALEAKELVDDNGDSPEFSKWINRELVKFPFLDRILVEYYK